jgi:hypothetical protein
MAKAAEPAKVFLLSGGNLQIARGDGDAPVQGGFVTFHALTRYVKVTLFKGAEPDPLPSGATPRSGEARWIDLYRGEFDEAYLANWMKQAAGLPVRKP